MLICTATRPAPSAIPTPSAAVSTDQFLADIAVDTERPHLSPEKLPTQASRNADRAGVSRGCANDDAIADRTRAQASAGGAQSAGALGRLRAGMRVTLLAVIPACAYGMPTPAAYSRRRYHQKRVASCLARIFFDHGCPSVLQERCRSGSCFYYSSFLPPTRGARSQRFALCRELDDGWMCATKPARLTKLDVARGDHAVCGRRADIGHPRLSNAQGRMHRCNAEEIVGGMAMDLDHLRYPDSIPQSVLAIECRLGGEVAARFSAGRAARTIARSAGMHSNWGLAFQLTKHHSKSARTRGRGRIYMRRMNLHVSAARSRHLDGVATPDFRRCCCSVRARRRLLRARVRRAPRQRAPRAAPGAGDGGDLSHLAE